LTIVIDKNERAMLDIKKLIFIFKILDLKQLFFLSNHEVKLQVNDGRLMEELDGLGE